MLGNSGDGWSRQAGSAPADDRLRGGPRAGSCASLSPGRIVPRPGGVVPCPALPLIARLPGYLAAEDRRGLTPLIYSNVNPYGVLRLDLRQRLPIDDEEIA